MAHNTVGFLLRLTPGEHARLKGRAQKQVISLQRLILHELKISAWIVKSTTAELRTQRDKLEADRAKIHERIQTLDPDNIVRAWLSETHDMLAANIAELDAKIRFLTNLRDE